MKEIVCFRPEYFGKFKCDGVNCRNNCCKRGWQVSIDQTTYEKYFQLGCREIIEQIIFHPQLDTYLIKHDEKGTCPFLNKKNLCSIQIKHGEDYLSTICRTYPRVSFNFGEFIEQSLDLSCPIAAEMILFNRERLVFELFQTESRFQGFNSLKIPEKFIPYMIEIQIAQISILQERELTINQRLIVLGFFLDKLEEISAREINQGALTRLIAIYESKKFLSDQIPLMLGRIKFDSKKFSRIVIKLFSTLHKVANVACISESFGDARREFQRKHATLLENYLVNEMFLNCYPWRFTGSITANYAVFIASYKIFEIILFESTLKGFDSKEDILELVNQFKTQMDHSGNAYAKIFEQIKNSCDVFSLMESLLER